MARHAARPQPDPGPEPGPEPPPGPQPQRRRDREPDFPSLLRAITLVLVGVNAVCGFALFVASPGASPTLQFLQVLAALVGAPLAVWSLLPFGAAALLLARVYVAGHLVAASAWMTMVSGTILGLITSSSRAPGASLIFAGLVVGMAAIHSVGLYFRRRARPAAEAG